ncbi:MAG TPA: histone H1 [Ignavibacteriales bacterium]|jgi:hypothetical protein|nr:histone H1 [Ignavibacteriales bacterium]
MAKRYDDLMLFVQNLEADFVKFYDKGQKAAGTRVRKAMLELKKIAQDIRVEVNEMKKTKEEEKTPAKKAPAKKSPAKKK